MPTLTVSPHPSGIVSKSTYTPLALIKGVFFEKSVKFPFPLGQSLVIHDFYTGNYPYKDQVQEWVKKRQEWGIYPIVVEIKREHTLQESHNIFESMRYVCRVIRLVKYNGIYMTHLLSYQHERHMQSISNDEPGASSYLGGNDYISECDLKKINAVLKKFRRIFSDPNNNQRLLRAMYFWNSSACSGTFERKAIEVFIALESLFILTTDGRFTEPLLTRSSWFLGKSNASIRTRYRTKIWEAYHKRGLLVHGGKFVEAKELPSIQNIHKIVRRIILQIINKKSFLSAFIKQESDLQIYFNTLTSGRT